MAAQQNKAQKSLSIPRVVQNISPPSISGNSSNFRTMSHAHTTLDSQRQASVYSYSSTRDITQFVRELHGRTFNNLSDAYHLPTDDAEWTRLDKQHSALTIGMGDIHPCGEVVDAILAFDPTDTEPKRVLDLGCGTGTWAIEMATRYPHAHVTGVDLAPTPLDVATIPSNLNFEIDDINLGLEHFHDKMDLVHMRCAIGGIKDFEKAIQDVQLCLKRATGGLVCVVDGDIDFLDKDHNKVKMKRLDTDDDVDSVSETGSWFQRVVWEAMDALERSGSPITRSTELIDLGLWDSPICDPDTARAGSVYIPIGPWARSEDLGQDQSLKYAGVLMRQNFLNIHRAFHVIARKYGIAQELLDEWSTHADRELNTLSAQILVRFRFCWARRRAGDGLPAAPLPQVPVSPTLSSSSSSDGDPANKSDQEKRHKKPRQYRNPYPEFELYYSREEAAAARERRRATIGVWPQSAAERLDAS